MTYEYPCRQCSGSKMINYPIPIGRICPQCNGKGHTDWINNAMGNRPNYEPPDHQLLYDMVMRNVQFLITEIKQQGMQLGMIIDINIEMYNQRDFEKEYMMQFSPLTIPE